LVGRLVGEGLGLVGVSWEEMKHQTNYQALRFVRGGRGGGEVGNALRRESERGRAAGREGLRDGGGGER
jgi:hypothetical protein